KPRAANSRRLSSSTRRVLSRITRAVVSANPTSAVAIPCPRQIGTTASRLRYSPPSFPAHRAHPASAERGGSVGTDWAAKALWITPPTPAASAATIGRGVNIHRTVARAPACAYVGAMSQTPAFLDGDRPPVPDIVVPRGVVPFYLPHRPVRGRLVRLGPLAHALLTRHPNHPAVTRLAGQSLALAAAPATALKFRGSFSVPAQG